MKACPASDLGKFYVHGFQSSLVAMTKQEQSHRNLNEGSCRRTQQRLVISPTHEEGFTQAWDTVGAGAYHPTSERAHLRGAFGSGCEVEC